jgi:hypothetical protein
MLVSAAMAFGVSSQTMAVSGVMTVLPHKSCLSFIDRKKNIKPQVQGK